MSKYTAEQFDAAAEKADAIRSPHAGAWSAACREQAAHLREREAAKAGVTDEMVRSVWTKLVAPADPTSVRRTSVTEANMRAVLEAIAPMLASARVPDGWQLVPIEVTKEMIVAGNNSGFQTYNGTWVVMPDACYKAMLKAAPKRGEG